MPEMKSVNSNLCRLISPLTEKPFHAFDTLRDNHSAVHVLL
jgi:hypothetical protein